MNINIKSKFLTTAGLAMISVMAFAQSKTVTGQVVDPDGKPVTGAVVVVEGSTTGTITDNNGNYSIAVPAGSKLNVSYQSYSPKNVSVLDGQDVYNVRLGDDAAQAAAESVTVTGKVTDIDGKPIVGASIVASGTTNGTISDNEGNYSITVPAGSKLVASFIGYETAKAQLSNGESVKNFVLNNGAGEFDHSFMGQKFDVGARKSFSRTETTSAVGVIAGKDLERRSGKNISNSILGIAGGGLIALDGVGSYYSKHPTWYVRGLQHLSDNSPLVLVDGIERDITTLSPFEVEEVQILKDAPALALLGYTGMKNAVLVKTKRGLADTKSVHVSYDHSFTQYVDLPKFVDAYTYALAKNEALAMEGNDPMYSAEDLEAFKNGSFANTHPNVDWVNEVFRKTSYNNRYNIEFRGGGKKFKYYAGLNLLSDKGFIKNHNYNDGIDTQDKYSRGNLTSNLDVQMTDYTHLQFNVRGTLSEMSKPGDEDKTDKADLWKNIYKVPALAFPIKDANGLWGGSSTYVGTLNPYAQSADAGYFKKHERALFADISLDQSLETFVEGLGLFGRLGYDCFSIINENYSRTYVYGSQTVTGWADGMPTTTDYSDGTDTSLGTGSGVTSFSRRSYMEAGFNFDRNLSDDLSLYAQVKWDYHFSDGEGGNSTLYRQNVSWYSHLGVMDKYFLDLAFVGSESNRLAKGYKWGFTPTVGLAWNISREDFLADNDVVNFLKLRASFGRLNNDRVPNPNNSDNWTYMKQLYTQNGTVYAINSKGDGDGQTLLGQAPSVNPVNEHAYKYNVGLDARLINALDLSVDFFMQKDKDLWVDGAGKFSAVYGLTAPYTNDGETTSKGLEFSADYNTMIGDLGLRVGGDFIYAHSTIDNQNEELRYSPNLNRTGQPINANFGLVALGLFRDQADIDNSVPQNLGSTPRPGDIKYKDVNGDGVVDGNDETQIGYSTAIPEIYYTFHVGLDFKGFDLSAHFNGVAHYTAQLNTDGYYRCLYDNRNLSQEAYDGRWTPTNLDAKYPRLSSASNDNNYSKNSTFFMKDRSYLKLRSVELGYSLSKDLLDGSFLTGARVFVRGNDLLTIDKIDNKDAANYGNTSDKAPYSANEPTTRRFSFGVSLSF